MPENQTPRRGPAHGVDPARPLTLTVEGETEGRLVPTLSSPMYKQSWDLDTGAVLDSGGGEKLPIAVFDVEVVDGHVHVSAAPHPGTGGEA